MRRLLRPSAFLAALVIGTTVAAVGCSYVNPPALAISESSDQEPYFTMTADELRAMVDEAEKSNTRTQEPTTFSTAAFADALNNKVQTNVLKHELASRGIVATAEDKADAQQQIQSSSQTQTEPTEAELTYAADAVALSRVLADDALKTGKFNLDEMARRLYDNAVQSGGLVTAAQLCLHIIEIDPVPATAGGEPTADEIAVAETKAKAVKARLDAGEKFETVANEDSVLKEQIPGGDLGCRDTSGAGETVLPPAIVEPLEGTPVGGVTEPLNLQGSFIIARIDNRIAEATTPYDTVKAQAENAAKQQLGSRFVTDRLTTIYAKTVVTIDPKFGKWDAERLQVTTPDGAATPTTPTTTVPTFDPSAILEGVPTETAPPSTTTEPPPSSTSSAPASTTTLAGGSTTSTTSAAGATTTSAVGATASSTSSNGNYTVTLESTSSTSAVAATTTAVGP